MPHSQDTCYEFGPFRLDAERRVLTRSGENVSLTPKATDILALLLKHARQLVEKEELMREVWPDSFVEEQNLTQNIFVLRRALGDGSGGAKYIETVPRRGYRFVAQVKRISSSESRTLLSWRETKLTSAPILAVLPFSNNTGDPKLQYLAEGMTENIIYNLSRISKLRVISRSAVFRFKGQEVDPLAVGQGLGVDVVLIGNMCQRNSGVSIRAELVDVKNNLQLWGHSFAYESNDILEVQDEITRQISAALRVRLTGEEKRLLTTRNTENSKAYQAYLEGRYHWSKYTREGIENAIIHFRSAINLDPQYALAYAAIIDCYLRLATNYLPPEGEMSGDASTVPELVEPSVGSIGSSSSGKVKLRHEWDWREAERELRRANELKADYPAAHQWYAAYNFSISLLDQSKSSKPQTGQLPPERLAHWATLTPNEEVQVLCTVAREQIEVGNYEAGPILLQRWWTPGEWPNLEGLNAHSAADLLFTTGVLTGCMSSTGHVQKGQRDAAALLNGSIAIFSYVGATRRSAEGRIELALSYYREGLFDLARTTLEKSLANLSVSDYELRSLALIRLGVVERHAGQLLDSLARLNDLLEILEMTGTLVTGRYHHELATTLRDLAFASTCKKDLELPGNRNDDLEIIINHFHRALYEFEAIGHHRYAAAVENSQGFLLLTLMRFDEAHLHLLRARRLFDGFDDKVRRAQVDDTLARLYLATERFDLAKKASERAVETLEMNDEEALLAEALSTKGMVYCKLKRYKEARGILEGAHRVAERCGDREGAGRALLVLIEEMCEELADHELHELGSKTTRLLANSQQDLIRNRLAKCLEVIDKRGTPEK
jgi:DNA-binding winged helix-turn-helix (wHTH) protein/tetratricopeptide (TPR) repeat protein